MNRFLWTLLGIAVTLGLIWQFYPLADAQNRLNELPLRGRGFKGNDVPLSPFEKEFFLNVNMLKRMYWINDERYFLYAIDGTHNRHAVHDPTYCFRGGGWEIIKTTPYKIPGGTAKIYELENGKERKTAILWFSDGKHHFDSPIRYWLTASLRRLSLGFSSEEPILIVIQPQGHTEINWKIFFRTFPYILSI